MKEKDNTFISLSFSDDSVNALRSRQSVRTTFKLSERSIEALSVLARQLGIRQKSLFDYLIDDVGALQAIAERFEDFKVTEHRVAKTYVISRRTLENLERVSSSCKAPRDILVEFSIERILPLILREKQKHAKRKEFLAELEIYLRRGEGILQRAEAELGPDDPVFRQILAMLRGVGSCQAAVEDLVGRGRKMENFQEPGED